MEEPSRRCLSIKEETQRMSGIRWDEGRTWQKKLVGAGREENMVHSRRGKRFNITMYII